MKITFTLFLFLFLANAAMAQAPQAFKYQAVARDGSGNLLSIKSVSFRISILKGTVSGTPVYTEQHNKTTNSFGLVDLEIGSGTSATGNFTTIEWGADRFFIKVEMDPTGGTAFQIMGTSQLMSVPYALYAKDVQNNNDADADAANEIQDLSIAANTLKLSKSSATVNLSPYLDNTDSQMLNYTGNVLSITGGNSVTITAGTGGDNWGTQTAITDATLSGNGLPAAPLKISQQGATTGQALKWNGTTWFPGTDNNGQWSQNGSNLYFNTGKVGIGKDPGSDTRQFQVVGGTNMAISAESSTGLFAALFAENKTAGGLAARFENVSGPVAFFGRNLVIQDGTQGAGKVLTSDANGTSSWQTLSAAAVPGGINGNIQFNNGGAFGGDNNLFWNNSSKRLGIGTTSPAGAMDINFNSYTNLSHLQLTETENDFSRLTFKNTANSAKMWTIAGKPDAIDANSLLNFWYFNVFFT